MVIQFIVDKKGKLLDQKVLKGVSTEIDAEALRVVGLMPQWQPGLQKGQKVNVKFILPIRFSLDGEVVPKIPTEPMPAPTFRGGHEELSKYVANNLRYPTEARQKGIEGTVFVRFMIESDGSVSNAKLFEGMKGIGYGCEEEALRVVRSMPKWNPAPQTGKQDTMTMILPIQFKLNEGKSTTSTTLKVQDFKATPNPSNGLFNLSFRADGKSTTIEVFNLTGQKVYNQVLNQFDGYFNGQIDLSKQPAGGYVIRIAQGAAVYSQQVVKE